MKLTLFLLLTGLPGAIPSTQPDSIDACGWFEEFPDGCVSFHATLHGNCFYFGTDVATVPDSLLDYVVIRVHARVNWQEWCDGYELILLDPLITTCEPVDLGCGVLFDDEEYCDTWDSPLYGELTISSLQGFVSGDTVRATGTIERCMASICFTDHLIYNTFRPCEQSPPAVTPDTWGALKALFKP